MRFDGRVALITGGGCGIGAATAQLFAREGAKVVVSDMDVAPAQEVAGPIGALAVACDVTSREQVDAMVARTTSELGRLDILVCCAGVIRDNLLFKMADEDWDVVIDTHLKGTFLCARAAQRPMVDQKFGKIVFLSSTSALGNRGQTNYSTAKAGLQGRGDADDARDRGADGDRLRDLQAGRRAADAAAPDRAAGGHRERDRVFVQRGVEFRLRADDLRPRRALTSLSK